MESGWSLHSGGVRAERAGDRDSDLSDTNKHPLSLATRWRGGSASVVGCLWSASASTVSRCEGVAPTKRQGGSL